MYIALTIVHVLACFGIIGIVLLQSGKGADIGSAFGGAGSQAVFGSMGTPTLLGKITTGIAIVFTITSFTLAILGGERAMGQCDVGEEFEERKVRRLELNLAGLDLRVIERFVQKGEKLPRGGAERGEDGSLMRRGPVALEDADLVAGIQTLHEDAEVQAGRPAADADDSQEFSGAQTSLVVIGSRSSPCPRPGSRLPPA